GAEPGLRAGGERAGRRRRREGCGAAVQLHPRASVGGSASGRSGAVVSGRYRWGGEQRARADRRRGLRFGGAARSGLRGRGPPGAAGAALAASFDEEYWLEKDSSHEFPWEFYKAFADAGWLGICVPEQHGGSGLGVVEASLLLEEVSASGAGMNGASSMHMSIFGMHPV